MKRVVTICFFLLLAQKVVAQTNSATEQQLEALGEVSEEALEDDTYLQQLVYLQRHPLNINAASREDLQLFKMLTSLQIESLLLYRKSLGPLISLHELQAIPYWDVTTIKKLLPFLKLQDGITTNFATQLRAGEHLVLLRGSRLLQQQRGYEKTRDNHYAGSRNKVLLRYKYQYKNELQYGIVAEKDAGEGASKTFQNPFDFTSFHFFKRNKGALKTLAVGDYTVNLGQGLIHWQALAFGKSSEALAIVRQSAVLRPYHGAGEFYFNCGVGATFQKWGWEATLFASVRKLSANVKFDSAGSTYISSFSTSGLHRTKGELRERHNTEQWSYGGNVQYRTTSFKIGINAVQHHFSQPIDKADEPYNMFAIQGRKWANASLDYSYTYKNVYLFGEAAIDQKGSKAFLQGLLASLHTNADIALLYRNISARYQSLYGNAFTESTMPTNERGFYIGVTIRPWTTLRLQAYADHYRFPWLRFRIDAPGGGNDYLLQATYFPNKRWEAYVRLRSENKSANYRPTGASINEVTGNVRGSLRLHLSYKATAALTLRTRAEGVVVKAQGTARERGFLLYGEALYKWNNRLSANGRLQYFETGGFNSRIYVYESDVLYTYSIPPFSGRGWRYYANVSYDVSEKVTAWLRWSHTRYGGQNGVGTGLEQTSGPHRSEVKLQVRWIF